MASKLNMLNNLKKRAEIRAEIRSNIKPADNLEEGEASNSENHSKNDELDLDESASLSQLAHDGTEEDLNNKIKREQIEQQLLGVHTDEEGHGSGSELEIYSDAGDDEFIPEVNGSRDGRHDAHDERDVQHELTVQQMCQVEEFSQAVDRQVHTIDPDLMPGSHSKKRSLDIALAGTDSRLVDSVNPSNNSAAAIDAVASAEAGEVRIGATMSHEGKVKRRQTSAVRDDEKVCPYCKQVFDSVVDCRNHRRTHPKPKVYKCGLCDKTFSQIPNLSYHRTIVHKDLRVVNGIDTSSVNTATTASSSTTSSSTATNLAAVASSAVAASVPLLDLQNVRVFHCDEVDCTFTYLTYQALLAHKENDHSGVNVKRPYRVSKATKKHACTFDGCNKVFAKFSDLTRHSRVHSGERPFECTHCGATFNQKYRLTTHLRSHTGEKPFSCKYCGKTFARGDAVQSHIFAIHRAKGSAF